MHPKRKITLCSHKHSFTPYPSLSPYRQTDRQTERQIHSLRVGWRDFFFSCAVVVVCQFFDLAGNRFWCYFILRVQYSCGIALGFRFWREIVFGFAYVLSVQYSCAVVSVFWLWRERVLVWSKKNSYWVSLFYRNNLITKVYFSYDPNYLILIISFLYCMDPQPYSHDCFSKIPRTFFTSRN